MFMTCVAYFLSAWTVTAFTVERFIVVYFPFHRVAVCTFRNTTIIIFCLIPLPLLFNSYNFFVYWYDQEECGVKQEFETLNHWLILIDIAFSYLIPLIAIFTLNSLIAYRMWKNDQERRENRGLLRRHSIASLNNSRSVTRSLIIVSTTFALLNVPINMISIRVCALKKLN